MHEKLDELRARLRDVTDLEMAGAVLGWDQQTYMPRGGAVARGRQMATLARIRHEKFTDPALGHLLDALAPYADTLGADSDDAALIRVTQRDYDRALRIPPTLLVAFYEHSASMYEAWVDARPTGDFRPLTDGFARTVDFSRQFAACAPSYDHIADPLIDAADYGMRAVDIQRIFGELRARLVPLVERVTAHERPDTRFLGRDYPAATQLALALQLGTQFGYDTQRGRQDLTHHPFATRFSNGDVRITTRVNPHDPTDALFSTLHECGHAMYEQGVAAHYDGTLLASGVSAGVHESQSRLWENLVGRSRAFCAYAFPQIQAAFPQQLAGVTAEQWYRAVNDVSRSLIRTDADELTYNLHVIIRFDLELALLDGSLAPRDLPDAWRARYQRDLGVASPDDKDGVLQDVHWYAGVVGGSFQGYTLGNILSAQFYNAAVQTHPQITTEVAHGEFGTLHGWLRENVYQHGRKYTPTELIARASGQPMTIEPYIAYLEAKYGELYPA